MFVVILGILSPDERLIDSDYENNNKIYYTKAIDVKKVGLILFEATIEQDGHIQYITVMPDKTKSFVKNYKTMLFNSACCNCNACCNRIFCFSRSVLPTFVSSSERTHF